MKESGQKRIHSSIMHSHQGEGNAKIVGDVTFIKV